MEKRYDFSVRYRNNPNGENESDRKMRWFFHSTQRSSRDQALMMLGHAFHENTPPQAHIVAIFTEVMKVPKSK